MSPYAMSEDVIAEHMKRSIHITRPHWRAVYMMLAYLLEEDKYSGVLGKPLLLEGERKKAGTLLRNLAKNTVPFYVNSQRSVCFHRSLTVNLTIRLPNSIESGMLSKKKIDALGDALVAFFRRRLGDVGGFQVALHANDYSPYIRPPGCHFHCWLLPFDFLSSQVGAVNRHPDDIGKWLLKRITGNRINDDGTVTGVNAWLDARRFTLSKMEALVADLESEWTRVLANVFCRPDLAGAKRLVGFDRSEKGHNPLIRDVMDHIRVHNYRTQPTESRIFKRASVSFNTDTGMMSITQKKKAGTRVKRYKAIDVFRHCFFYPFRYRSDPRGVLEKNPYTSMLFDRCFEETLLSRDENFLLNWATKPKEVIEAEMTPFIAERIIERIDSARESMGYRGTSKSKLKDRELLWRHFGNTFAIILEHLSFMARRRLRSRRRESPPSPSGTVPTYGRVTLQSQKAIANADAAFISQATDRQKRLLATIESHQSIGRRRKEKATVKKAKCPASPRLHRSHPNALRCD